MKSSSSSSRISTPCASLRLIGKLSYKQKQYHVIPPVQSDEEVKLLKREEES